MPLSDEDKKRIKARATGEAITSQISTDDQIAAIREQVAEITANTKTPVSEKFQRLQEVVANFKKGRP
jgi:hypothetical protein